MMRGGSSKRAKQRPARVSADGLRKLPDGWLRWWDEGSNQFYYQNTKTNEVSWSDPTRWKVGQWFDQYYFSGDKQKASRVGRRQRFHEEAEEGYSSDEDGSSVGTRGPETIEQAFTEFCRSQHYEEGLTDEFDDSDNDDVVDKSINGKEHEVWLHVYDVKFRGAGVINALFRPLTMGGAFHTGIEIFGREWSYGATTRDCGIFSCQPKSCEPHKYRESISLGCTRKNELGVFEALLRLAPLWWGTSYDLLRKNCNSFCIVFAGALGVQTLPEWVHSLADGAAQVDDRARRVFAALTAAPSAQDRRMRARREARQRASDLSIFEAAVVADDYGHWKIDRYATYAAAKKRFDDLPLRHASALFVKPSHDSPWRIRHTYGLPNAVANIQKKFLPEGRLDLHQDTENEEDDDDLDSLNSPTSQEEAQTQFFHRSSSTSSAPNSPNKNSFDQRHNSLSDDSDDSVGDLEEFKIEPRRAHSDRRHNDAIYVTSRLPPPKDNLNELVSTSGTRITQHPASRFHHSVPIAPGAAQPDQPGTTAATKVHFLRPSRNSALPTVHTTTTLADPPSVHISTNSNHTEKAAVTTRTSSIINKENSNSLPSATTAG